MHTNSPTHEEIAQRAREIWLAYGSPDGRDTEIWLAAENQLIVGPSEPDSRPETSHRDNYDSPAEAYANAERHAVESRAPSRSESRGNGNSQSQGSIAVAGSRVTERPSETTAQASSPDDAAAKSAQQKKSARAPKTSVKTAPKAAPTESGKPLWDKPHSS